MSLVIPEASLTQAIGSPIIGITICKCHIRLPHHIMIKNELVGVVAAATSSTLMPEDTTEVLLELVVALKDVTPPLESAIMAFEVVPACVPSE
jgi:hypothetical protein